MKKSGKVEPVTELKRVCGNAFSVTRHEEGVRIRRLPCPTPAPKGRIARIVVFPWATVRKGR